MQLNSQEQSWEAAVRKAGSFARLKERFHQAAIAEAGYDDFGSSDYLEGFDVLMASLDANPEPAMRLAEQTGDVITSALVGRLYTQAGWKARPEVLRRDLLPPLFIGGIPRSGTTALHRLLAMDRQFQGMERWLARAPMPRPPRDTWNEFPAFRAALGEVAGRNASAPDAQRAHRIAAEEVDECLIAMAQSFMNNWFGSRMDVPEYDAWFLRQDETASYRRYGNILRLIGADDDRRWLLKNPSHILGIDGLLNAFSDALIIQTHRHPAETIASLSNLLANILGAGEAQRARISQRNMEVWRIATERMMAAQDRYPGRVYNVDFRTFLERPMAIVRGIYAHFGLELSSEAEERMTRWIGENPQNKHGAHHYTLEEGQLNHATVSAAFADYIARYHLETAR